MSLKKFLLVTLSLIVCSTAAAAQQPSSIAARVAAAPEDAAVEMRFPPRDGVCGDGRSYIAIGHTTIRQDSYFNGDARDDERAACAPGPVRVRLDLRGHDVSRVHVFVGDDSLTHAGSGAVTDLGAVDPRDAAAYLLDVASRAGSDQVGDRAILGAVLADRAVVWPALLAIARDGTGRGRAARGSAAFWLSRFASAARNGHPGRLAADDSLPDEDDERDARGHAVFALSQLPRHEGVPALVDVARTHKDPAIRRKAMFWLGQSNDPRGLALFEEILRQSDGR